jgi:penicillin V acylase-like amidase (Ntn superfamily)
MTDAGSGAHHLHVTAFCTAFVSDLYFPGYAGYADVTSEDAPCAMASYEFGNWLLGNFATVDEVRAHLQEIVLVSTAVEALHPCTSSFATALGNP